MAAPKKTTTKKASTAKAGTKKATGKTAVTKKTTAKKAPDSKKIKFLVIVESPAKAKTLKKILGGNYQIKASVGHIRDLPKKKIGVDIKANFEPVYEVMADKVDVVEDLKAAAAKCETVYLAADPDREGEAIAWHTKALLQDSVKDIRRIEFNQITKNAILEAIDNPRQIDQDMVDAQQARRVLDRLVGYKLSPLLWKKINKGLSAGRVQSVAVRLICEREEEIEAFVPVEYWSIKVDLSCTDGTTETLTAELAKIDDKKAEIHNEAEATAIVNVLEKATYEVSAVKSRESHRKPLAPFITSTLQREASTRHGYSVKKTMQVAQKLYEGIDAGEGLTGLITYMRTDSTRIAPEAQEEAKEYIVNRYGKQYCPEEPRVYSKKGKGAQDAHEAIRPTSVTRTPSSLKPYLKEDQLKLYKIIWERFVASQMESAKIKTKTIEIVVENYLLRTSQSKVMFDGYMAAYKTEDDEAPEDKRIPDLEKGDVLKKEKVLPKQHFTEPPPRFNEASLVKAMEELGIGRPSTYAPTIGTIQTRGYVLKVEKALKPTLMGKAVNGALVKHFNDIVDSNFTANMEARLDQIAEHKLKWQDVIKDFYEPFEATLKKATDEMEKILVIAEGVNCPECGSPMSIKNSRWGTQFLGCTAYPECKSTMPLTDDQKPAPEDKPSDEKCLDCKGDMVIRYGRFGEYLACIDDACKAKRPIVKSTGVKCLKCKVGDIVEKKSRRGKIFYACDQYPKCEYALWNMPTGKQCPECDSMLVEKHLKRGSFHACSSKECKYTIEIDRPAEPTPAQ